MHRRRARIVAAPTCTAPKEPSLPNRLQRKQALRLMLIDLQHDFVTDGSLRCANVENIRGLVRFVLERRPFNAAHVSFKGMRF